MHDKSNEKELNIENNQSNTENYLNAEKFFHEIFEWVRAKGFINTSLKELLTIKKEKDWFIFLSKTKDFELIARKEGRNEELGLVSLTSKKGIIVEPEFRLKFESKLKEFEKNYLAFINLSSKNQEEIIKKFIKKK